MSTKHHLIAFSDASFSENFYGLKRRRRPFIESERATAAVGGIPAGEVLRSQEIWRSLLFLVSGKYTVLLKRLQQQRCRLGCHISGLKLMIILKNWVEA